MTQTSTLKTAQIVSLNAVPAISLNTGEGAQGLSKRVEGFVTALSADSTSSVYSMVRIPTNAKIKKVTLNSAVASAGAGNIGVYYSDSTQDDTNPANQGTAVSASWFAAAQSLVGTGQNVDVTFLNIAGPGNSFSLINTPLWLALGLAQDPGGAFDVKIAVTTQITTGGVVGISVDYVL